MRILFSSNPMFGHVNPMLPLALAASQAGHTVRYATGPDMVDHVRRHGVETVAVGASYAKSRERFDEPWLDYFARVAHDRTHELLRLVREWTPDLIVREETELAAAIVAAATGSRSVVHGLGIPPPPALWYSLLPRVADVARHWHVDGVAERFANTTYLDICPPSLQRRERSFWTDVQPVRAAAVAPATSDELPLDVTNLCRAPTAHITLGTVFNENVELLQTAIAGVVSLGLNVVVTTGPATDPKILGELPPNVVAHAYVPHGLFLPQCSVVISQGGAGLMFATLALGLPQLVLPQGADQFTNADACVAAGAALSISDEISSEAIARAVARLLDDPAFADAASRIAAEMRAMPDADEVLDALTVESGDASR
jgi:UDP:flavonoid glycosyltransferase YjiC (YdhE family)